MGVSSDVDADALDAAACELLAAKSHAFFDFEDLEDPEDPQADVVPIPIADAACSAAVGPPREVTEDEDEEDRAAASHATPADLVADEHGERVAPAFIYTVGICSNAAAQLCGRYVALCRRSARGCDVSVRVRHDYVLVGTDSKPLYVFLGPLRDSPTQATRRPGGCDVKSSMLLCFGIKDAGKWHIVRGSSGRWLAEAPSLHGPWIVQTPFAQETEFALRVACARTPPEAALAVPDPQARPRSDPGLLTFAARVISLPEREANVEKLQRQLEDICGRSSLHVGVKAHPAWDTRSLDAKKLRDLGFVRGERWEEGAQLLGCALSHSQLWVDLAADGGGSLGGTAGALLVLEDDAVFNLARPVEAMLPDILSRASGHDLVLLGGAADERWSAECLKNRPPQWIGEYLIRIRYFGGFWGYLITPRGARRALYALWGDTREPRALHGDCDVEVSDACGHGEIDATMCIPNLVLHPGPGFGRRRTRCSCVNYEYYVTDTEWATQTAHIGSSQRRAEVGRITEEVPTAAIEALIRKCRRAASARSVPRQLWQAARPAPAL